MRDGGWGMKEREMTAEIHPSSLRPHPSCKLVGARGFEPPTPCSQSRCATRLRYTPTLKRQCINRLPETAIPRLNRLRCSLVRAPWWQRRFPLPPRGWVEDELERMAVRSEAQDAPLHRMAGRRLIVVFDLLEVAELQVCVE